MKPITLLPSATFLLFAASFAHADQQTYGDGSPYWSMYQEVRTDECIQQSTTSTICALFAAGTTKDHLKRRVVVTSDAIIDCCWVAADGLTIDANKAVVDGTAGPGACFTVTGTASVWRGHPSYALLNDVSASGARDGVCATRVSNAGDVLLYVPCDALAVAPGCGPYSAGTCTDPAGDLKSRTGALMLLCESASGAAYVRVTKELVIK